MNNEPRSWDDVTLGRYMQLTAIPEGCSVQDRTIRTAAILTGRSLQSVKDMPVAEYRALVQSLAFTNEVPSGGFAESISIDGRTYRLIEDFAQVSLGELIDLEEYMSSWKESMHLALGVLYREPAPDGSRPDYDPARAKDVADALWDGMTASQAHAASVFFSLIGSACLSRGRASSAVTT